MPHGAGRVLLRLDHALHEKSYQRRDTTQLADACLSRDIVSCYRKHRLRCLRLHFLTAVNEPGNEVLNAARFSNCNLIGGFVLAKGGNGREEADGSCRWRLAAEHTDHAFCYCEPVVSMLRRQSGEGSTSVG